MLRLASCGLLHRVRASSSSFNSNSTPRRIAAPVLYTKPQVLFRQSCYQTTTTMPLERSTAPLVWIDCEMTGLDSETDSILQICCFITDAHLRLLEPTGFETTIHHPKHILDKMSPWCIDTHGRTGLTAAVLASTTTPEAAATDLLSYIRKYVPQPRMAVLAGNSVHADKAFLARGPYAAVLDWLHYRILDVSAIKEAARRWGSEELLRAVPAKKEVHLAKDDILESIDEMRFYKERLFGEQPTHSQE